MKYTPSIYFRIDYSYSRDVLVYVSGSKALVQKGNSPNISCDGY